MDPQLRTAEEVIARMGSLAHGVVTRTELLDAGVTATMIRDRVRKGALIPQYRGVYRVGHRAPSLEAAYMAAVKACGDGAALCGAAAGYLLRVLKSPIPPPEVLTAAEKRMPFRTTATRHLDPRDVTKAFGIPVTTVPRTLVDLAAALDDEALARACHEAGVLYRTTPRQVEAVLERRPNSRGAATLRAVIGGDVKVVLSKLEKRFLELLIEAGLPLPVTNRIASGRRVDCRWPDHKLTVELDSFRFHNSRRSWEQTFEREREARRRGDEFRRYSYADVFEGPSYMLGELRGLLATA